MTVDEAPDPSQVRDLAEFITALGELRQWAGGPSYRTLAKRVGPLLRPPQVIAHTTVSSVFQAHRRRLDIDLVTTVVRALGVDEPEVARWRRACVRVHVKGKANAPDEALRQLPANLATFTGREADLKQLLDVADIVGNGSTTVVISAIDGMAGIGKTTLAVHVGHLVAKNFPDGQLFVDLHGHSAGSGPRDPNDALGQLLRSLGLEPQAIPAELEERAKAFRTRLAGSRTLIVLDDAASAQQVRPLLPAAPGCLVLVTSRNRLKALDDAHVLPLDVLDPGEAIALLRRHVGPDRVAADDPAVASVAELCGYLPLALRIAAANLAHRRTWTIDHLAARLRAGLGDLAAFDDGDRQVRAAFDLSYRNLTPDQQAVFCHLGLIPGPEADVYAVAALLNTGLSEADTLLEALTDRSLLTETVPGRYRLHDLLRRYSRTLAVANESTEQRKTALDRLLHYYAHTAQTASKPIARRSRPAPDGPAPAHAPDLTDPDTARAWLRTERPNLDAAYTHAHTHHLDCHTTALAAGMAEILLSDGPWTRALQIHQDAATAADQDHPAAHAAALTDLGLMRYLTGDYPGAEEAQTRAVEMFRRTGDSLGEANALNELGRLHVSTGNRSAAQNTQTRALEIFRQIHNRQGEANALTELALLPYLAADYPAAENALMQALRIFREIGNRQGEANVLTGLGLVLEETGDLPGMEDALTRALEIYRQIGNRQGEANALNNLGRLLTLTGHHAGAENVQMQALKIFRQIGHRSNEANVLSHLGRLRRQEGNHSGAEDIQIQALKIFREIGNLPGEAYALIELGRLRHSTGDYPAAEETLKRALEILRQTGERGSEAYALNFYAAAIAALGDRSRALTLYQQALAMNRAQRKPDDEAISLEGIADHYLATGDPARGLAHLNQALEIYRRLGMRVHIERIQAQLSDLDAHCGRS